MPFIHKILTTTALCLAAWLCVAYAAPEKVALEQAELLIRYFFEHFRFAG